MQIPYRPKLQVNLYEIVKPKLAVIESGAQAHHFEFKPNIAGLHPSNPAQKKLGKGDLALRKMKTIQERKDQPKRQVLCPPNFQRHIWDLGHSAKCEK